MTNRDAELAAMKAIAEALEGFDEAAVRRVLEWTASSHGVDMPSAPAPAHQEMQVFDAFVDLFDQVNPSTGTDRALLAAYWLQEVEGNLTFKSKPVNDALKDLGYPLSNVTATLGSLEDRNPALVRQVRKGGSSKQAHKEYKVTAAGIKAVREMLRDQGDSDGD